MGCVEHDESKDLHADLSWAISPNNGILQLISLIPINILYQSQHNAGVVGGLWTEHHKIFANFIQSQAPRSVLEIGGAHGILSREYKKLNKIDWTILEPNPSPAEGVSAEFIEGFFDGNFTFDGEFDTIIHSHVFEHMYHPDEFMKKMSSFIPDGCMQIFSIPNMIPQLENKFLSCLDPEHSILLTELNVEYLLKKYGFKVPNTLGNSDF